MNHLLVLKYVSSVRYTTPVHKHKIVLVGGDAHVFPGFFAPVLTQLSKVTDNFSHMLQRWEAKIRRKESSPQPGFEHRTTMSWVITEPPERGARGINSVAMTVISGVLRCSLVAWDSSPGGPRFKQHWIFFFFVITFSLFCGVYLWKTDQGLSLLLVKSKKYINTWICDLSPSYDWNSVQSINLSSVIKKNSGRAGDRPSNVLFSSPVRFRLSYMG